jgi:hypothetical protein
LSEVSRKDTRHPGIAAILMILISSTRTHHPS